MSYIPSYQGTYFCHLQPSPPEIASYTLEESKHMLDAHGIGSTSQKQVIIQKWEMTLLSEPVINSLHHIPFWEKLWSSGLPEAWLTGSPIAAQF